MVSANGSAKASEVVWKSMPCLAGFAWLFFSSHSKAMAHYDKRKYICQYNIASAQVCLRFLAFPRSSCHTVFSGTFHISAPHPVPWNSVLQTLPPSLFNAFPLHSNANKRVIGLRCTSMLFSPVFVHSDLRSATHRPRLLSPRPTVLAACPATPHHFRFSPLHLLVLSNFFRINTYKSLSKQTTLTFFRINTYKGNNILDSVRCFWHTFDSEERHERQTKDSPTSHHSLRGRWQLPEIHGYSSLAQWCRVSHLWPR